jgi:acyl-CoA thioesterase FadM
MGNYPRRHVEVEYLDVMSWDDQVETTIEVVRLGRTSITWRWEMQCGGRRCAAGTHTVVHVGEDGRSVELPRAVRIALSE